MPRVARVVVAGYPYHVTQRGNRGERVFYRNGDYQNYLEWLKSYCEESHLKIYAYCLMDNHIHLVVVPEREDSLERVFKPLHMRYAQAVNRRRGWKGHFWQGRFFSSILDEAYLWTAVKYVERNPVQIGLVEYAEDYKWSSAAAHCNLRADNLLSEDLPLLKEIPDWAAWLRDREDSTAVTLLRRNTDKGIPTGSDRFISRLEALLKRPLKFRPRGRPRLDGKL
jgi:putative transposase